MPATPATETDRIRVRGARQHNLRAVDADFPLDALTVVTGVSGSGKSSLVLDTLYAEGQRRYVESFSTYARQFLERMDRPDVDLVDGIPPAVAIEQRNQVRTSRSTVGTLTEIQDHLKLLWARAGTVHCEGCDAVVTVDEPRDVYAALKALPAGTKAVLTFPLPMGGDVGWDVRVGGLRAVGLPRLLVEGRPVEAGRVAEPRPGDLPPQVVVDRWVAGTTKRGRALDSVETAYRLGRGFAVLHVEGEAPRPFSRLLHCAACDLAAREPVPNLFSFNSPLGACAACRGFGRIIGLDLGLVVPDPLKSLHGGAVKPWTTPKTAMERRDLKKACAHHGIDDRTPWSELSGEHRAVVVDGDDEGWYGVRGWFQWLEGRTYKMHVRVLLSRYRAYETCPDCDGGRLRPEALRVRVGDRNLPSITGLSLEEARSWFDALRLRRDREEICGVVLREIRARLGYLCDVGLGYLTLDRAARTLSGGEAQRVNLTTALGSSLVNTLFVLDEPSIGLHPRDTDRLLGILEGLRDRGNAVVVVEHDADVIGRADHVIDLGPGPGEHGGRVVFQGTVKAMLRSADSLTGRHMSGKVPVPAPGARREPSGGLELRGITLHNLRDVDVDLPLGVLTGICGVSGSGKSTLVEGALVPALLRRLGRPTGERVPLRSLGGGEDLDDVVLVDQSPIGRTPRSNPATYTGAWTAIRKAFAETDGARSRRFKASTFSFNSAGGRCERCEGAGHETLEMQFLADVFVPCPDCRGARFRPEVLKVRLRGRTADEVLRLTAEEALEFFSGDAVVRRKLRPLVDVGLGYLRLGQPATTLSGGEAQRLKLARHLSGGRRKSDRVLFLLDEPTTGLHAADVSVLMQALRALVERGHSVVVVEHNLDVLAACDHLVELGPEGGAKGGRVVATGSPAAVAKRRGSRTAPFLRRRQER